MVTINLASGNVKLARYNHLTNGGKALNAALPFNDATNRLGATLLDESSYVKYFPDFLGQNSHRWLLQRATQFAIMNNNRLKLEVYGDSELEVGMIVNLQFPYIAPTNNAENITVDNYKSGNYLVTKVRHRIFGKAFTTTLELCKDSNVGGIPPAVESAEYKKAKTS